MVIIGYGRILLRLPAGQINISRNPSAIIKNPPKFSQSGIAKQKINTTKSPQCDSAIGIHLQNKKCANNYNDQQFSILARARIAFHLPALEATCIKTLKTNPMSP